jgi:hypothetical protein
MVRRTLRAVGLLVPDAFSEPNGFSLIHGKNLFFLCLHRFPNNRSLRMMLCGFLLVFHLSFVNL